MYRIYIYIFWLVVWNHGILWLSRNSWEWNGKIIPIDEVIFFRGVGWNHQPDLFFWIHLKFGARCLALKGWILFESESSRLSVLKRTRCTWFRNLGRLVLQHPSLILWHFSGGTGDASASLAIQVSLQLHSAEVHRWQSLCCLARSYLRPCCSMGP